jgi:hypothetical protein
MTGMGGSLGRSTGLFLAGLAVLCLSFWVTLMLIDNVDEHVGHDVSLADVPLTNDDGSPRNARASTVRDLPAAPTGLAFGAAWDGIEGVNALIMGPGPTGGGNLALSLVATRDNGRHRLGLALVGVPASRPIRVTAWFKAPQATHMGIDVRDGEQRGRGPRNSGSAIVDLSSAKVLAASGNARASIEAASGSWMKVAVEMASSDGLFVIYFSLLGPGDNASFGGSREQMIFGGIEITTG